MSDQTRDTLNVLSGVLLRCWISGFILLLIWLAVTFIGGEAVYQMHAPMFSLSVHELAVIFYCGMGLLKLVVLTCFFIPWLSIKLVLRSQTA